MATDVSVGSPLLWGLFLLLILGLLALDLWVFHRRPHSVSSREALVWSVVWIGLSLTFNAWIYYQFGPTKGLEFLTGYLIEKALSVDNIFVFLVIFSYFKVDDRYQHRVLFWGILGALVLRAGFIALGVTLLSAFHWVLFIFGGFLVVTGFRILVHKDDEVHPERNPVVRLFRKIAPMTADYEGERFLVRRDGKLLATPLLLVLAVVEATDIVFAVDSIPAIFAITLDPFIVFTSNIFAILGLRALYFLLASMMHKFRYLKPGLAIVLMFVGFKMLVSDWYKLPIEVSLGVIVLIFTVTIVASWLNPAKPTPQTEPAGASAKDGARRRASP